MKADLHIHSNISDGSDTIETIIEQAIKKGLDMIAITDHDTLAHLKKIPPSSLIKVIAGVEISAVDRATGTKAHTIGYNIKNTELVEQLTLPLLNRRHQNSLRQIEVLQKNGLKMVLEKIKKADEQFIYKQHIMEYLVRTKQATEMFGEFYQTVFKNGGICDFDIEYIDVREAVEVIQQAGGQCVLAHPGQQKNFYLLDRLPFDGVEYNHLIHSARDRQIIKEYAEKKSLFLSGGSDYHGKYEAKKVAIGEYLSEESGVRALC